MTVKEWLNRGYRIENEIRALRLEKERAFSAATSMTGGMSSAKVKTSDRNAAEDKMIRAAEYSRALDERLKELYTVKREILAAINAVGDGTLRQLLILRYIRCWTWERIAEEMHYSYVHIVHNLHPRALEKIKDVIECNTPGVMNETIFLSREEAEKALEKGE